MLCEQGVQIKPGCRYESAGWRDLIEVFDCGVACGSSQ